MNTALNPRNVPTPDDRRWIYAAQTEASRAQQTYLADLLEREGLEAADLFGDGFSSSAELSRWAVHWAIDLLESREQARYMEQRRQEFEEQREQQMKSMIAHYFREKHPELRKGYRA